jgi:hypothetical protein
MLRQSGAEETLAQGYIYVVGPEGGLKRMRPSPPESETRMQELVALHPDLITDGDGDLLLIRREQPLTDSEDGAGRWSLDHLLVTRGAVPVLVELKRAADTRLRREVVGQMLDYAANGTAYWQAGRIAESFAQTASVEGIDPDERLAEFIGEREPVDFWNQVDANFKAGRIKLVFVADEIPRELARIVEFLNEQMRADVRAVELRWFTDEDGVTAMSPRICGETERAAAAKNLASPFSGATDGTQRGTVAALRAHITRREEAIRKGLETYGTRPEMEAYIGQAKARIAAIEASPL